MRSEHHSLPGHTLGSQRELVSFHFGEAGRGEKVYLQASLHADELPGMLVLHHLKALLAAADARGVLRGEVVLVPVANPIGLSQTVLRTQLGRFDLASGDNFNRHYPEFNAAFVEQLRPNLTDRADDNRRAVRAAVAATLAEPPQHSELAALRHALFSLAFDADVVLDLHCDCEAVMHLYTEAPYQSQAEPLYRYLEAETVLLARGSGGASFDEALSGIWWQLGDRLGHEFPIPLACFSATVELRGAADVSHELARADAGRLYAYLQHRGVIDTPAPLPPPARCSPTPLAGAEILRAPHPGVIAFYKQPGDWVTLGETVVDIVDPLTDRVTPIRSQVEGRLFARENRRYATRGMDLCKIAGSTPFRTGPLLTA